MRLISLCAFRHYLSKNDKKCRPIPCNSPTSPICIPCILLQCPCSFLAFSYNPYFYFTPSPTVLILFPRILLHWLLSLFGGRGDVRGLTPPSLNLSFLCTGGAYYVPYSFLFISNKFCNRGGPAQAGWLSSLMHLSGPSRVIKFLYSLAPPPPHRFSSFLGIQMALAYRLDAIS
jgi:hypothetical protein